MKSHYCGEITSSNLKEEVTICGWVHRRRDHGGVIFLDVRDIKGICQAVVNPDNKESFKLAESIRNEYVVQINGVVRNRLEGTINKNMHTGEIEIEVKNIDILSKANTPVFPIDEYQEVNEDVRLKNRVLDLRRPEMNERIITRSKITSLIRNYLDKNEFHEIETPILTKATPEGARDYIIPSRVQPGSFYALPQSPQLFKQLLMIGGLNKYYQIARCFRDEDLRADRQPEFTQLDLEMSFITEEEIIDFNENLIKQIWKEILNINFSENFPRMTWKYAMDNYGTDRPDTRYEMLLKDVGEILGDIGFNIFTKAIKSGGSIKCLTVDDGNNSISNVRIKPGGDIFQVAQEAGAGGLAFIRIKNNDIDTIGAIKNNLNKEKISELLNKTGAKEGDLILLGAGDTKIVNQSLDKVRQYLAKELKLIKKINGKDKWNFLWITDFPMFERNEEEDRFEALHHPFCSPKNLNTSSQKELQNSDAQAYDLVLNGLEIGGGSIRIHESQMQRDVLKTVGLSNEEINEKFGFLLEALEMGAPPHGGIAFGIDRITMLILGADSIRETIAFPKNQQSKCVLTNAPSNVANSQLKELDIEITFDEK